MTGRLRLAAAAMVLLGLLAGGCSVGGASPGFYATGSMSVSRMSHAAAALPGGRVLVVGGYSAPEGGNLAVLASAELYDPDSGGFDPTGSMATARAAMTATVLRDGRVLVAGGYSMDSAGATVPLASAELYDPNGGTFSRTGPMSVARYNHTATLLPDGRVVVAGGTGEGGSLASVEIFDPGKGTFTPAGPMAVERSGHTATLLGNGQVLLVGGARVDSARTVEYLASAELFDPEAGAAGPAASLSDARYNHSAAMLQDGRVLIAGGLQQSGTSARWSLSGAEVFDLAAAGVVDGQAMGAARTNAICLALPDGRVLMAGGMDLSAPNRADSYLASAELFDPGSGTWVPAGSMSAKRAGATATLISGGRVLIAGGGDDRETLSSAEIYQP